MMPLNARRVRMLKCAANRINTRKHTYVALAILGLLALLNAPAIFAQQPALHGNHQPFLLSQNTLITRKDAAAIARQGREIQVLKVDKKKTPNGPVYSVKLLTKKGRVKHVRVDAVSGEIIRK